MKVSVLIKAYNEQENIARTIECASRAIEGLSAEIIVADSLSSDATVRIALDYPVRVVRLENPSDRGCGAGAQLGYQFSHGEYVLLIDGDMELQREFVQTAIHALDNEPSVAGVAGLIRDLHFDNPEYRARRQRRSANAEPGYLVALNGGGLFRRKAIDSIGYFTDRNLHSFEEFEQGLRLHRKGWLLKRLPVTSVLHHGHRSSMLRLLLARWRSRYLFGSGELLRSTMGCRDFWRAASEVRMQLIVAFWILGSFIALVSSCLYGVTWLTGLFVATPPVALLMKKRNISLVAYSLLSWVPSSVGLVAGLFTRRVDPRQWIESHELATVGGHEKTIPTKFACESES